MSDSDNFDEYEDEAIELSGRNADIARLSASYFARHPNAKRVPIYLCQFPDEPSDDVFDAAIQDALEDATEDTGLNRIGGSPTGVDWENWPCKDDEEDLPMHHLFTLDMASVPRLQARVGAEVRAVSVFVYEPDLNEAWQPFSGDSAVVLLNAQDIAKGRLEGELPAGEHAFKTFGVQEVEVPADIFYDADREWEVEHDPEIDAIRAEVYSAPARLGGEPIWLQGNEHSGSPFLMQFDEGFVPINLGDAGVMYVFQYTAFWQCY